jgi:hypothetical protein
LVVAGQAVDVLACSCARDESDDLWTELTRSRTGANAIYLARVSKPQLGARPGRALLSVVESFKGEVSPGELITVRAGGFGDCSIEFAAGALYLVYGRESPTDVWMCSRTRRVDDRDPEVEWLKTGRLPPAPKVLQREMVTCQPCDPGRIGDTFVGRQPRACAADRGLDVAAQVAGTEAFSVYDSEPGPKGAVDVELGRTREGQLFKLSTTGGWARCQRRVVLQICKQLATEKISDWRTEVRCVTPGPERVLCDETQSREERWLPLEDLASAKCSWRHPARATCELSEQRPTGADIRGPVLRCHPTGMRGDTHHVCEVVP